MSARGGGLFASRQTQVLALSPSSKSEFDEWLASSTSQGPDKRAAFADFTSFLEAHSVAGVVPNWQLWRVDAHYAKRCQTGYFNIPPKDRWLQIVPTLELLRDEVIPVTGPLEVVSAYRSPQINLCVNGASGSKHLTFSALDLVALDMTSRERLFTDLCALQQSIGRRRAMGLGAYFDPDDLARGKKGRFHIDAEGYRTWGFDYSSKSNPCPKLL